MKLKKGDILIFFCIIAIALIILVPKNEKGDFAVLEIDGKTIETFDLSVDTKYTYFGEYENSIVVSNGKLFIEYSTCPDKTCVNSGELDSDGGVICCLPNKLLIRIVSDTGLDVISG